MESNAIKLGIIGAMEVEVEILVSRLENVKTTIRAGSVFREGILEGVPAVVVQSCTGKVNAALCAQILCDCYEVTHMINTGIAGSLSPELRPGDLVISRDVMYHDFDLSRIDPDFQLGQVPIPGMHIKSFPADSALADCAFAAGEQLCPGHVQMGRVATGDQFVCTQEQRSKIIADTNALCVEMEGAAVAHAAWRNGVPFLILRVISDHANECAKTDYPSFEQLAAYRCADVTTVLSRRLGQSLS